MAKIKTALNLTRLMLHNNKKAKSVWPQKNSSIGYCATPQTRHDLILARYFQLSNFSVSMFVRHWYQKIEPSNSYIRDNICYKLSPLKNNTMVLRHDGVERKFAISHDYFSREVHDRKSVHVVPFGVHSRHLTSEFETLAKMHCFFPIYLLYL